jgi:hypothetical protein
MNDHILKQKDPFRKGLIALGKKHDQFANHACLRHMVKTRALGGDMPPYFCWIERKKNCDLLSTKELHSQQGKDENEQEEQEQQAENGPHTAQQGYHQVPQVGPVSATQNITSPIQFTFAKF